MLLSLFLSFVVALVWLAVTVSGLVALWRGVRGTLVNDHLYCRACGYDLEGAPSRPLQCNECGASLIGPKKVKAGRRRPRMDLVVVGLVIIALPVFGAFELSTIGATGPVTVAPKTKPVAAPRRVRRRGPCGVCSACLARSGVRPSSWERPDFGEWASDVALLGSGALGLSTRAATRPVNAAPKTKLVAPPRRTGWRVPSEPFDEDAIYRRTLVARPWFGALGLSMSGEMGATGPVTVAPKTTPVAVLREGRRRGCGVCTACRARKEREAREAFPVPTSGLWMDP